MKRLLIASVVATAFAAPMSVVAQTAPPPAPAHVPEQADDAPIFSMFGFDLTGYVDVGYTNLNGRGAFNTTPGGPGVSIGGPNRVFDYRRNSLRLHQVALTLAKPAKEGFGGLLNVTLGRDADVIASYKTGPSRGDGCNLATGQSATGGCRKTGYDITQAYVQYASGPASVILGKFVTSAGAEVINSTVNSNFSRSILFGYAIPFSHTGARLTYAAADTLSLIGGINNGWDVLKDTNSAKTLEIGASFVPFKDLTFTGMVHTGKERVGGLVNTGPEGTRTLFDGMLMFSASEKLSLMLNYDWATQANATTVTPNGAGTAKWSGWAAYAGYQLADQWKLSVRGEYFDDRDGYRTGVIQKWKEATLTLAHTPIKNLELRAEVRGDWSNVAAFISSDGTTAKKSQRSAGLEAIYKF